jgi:N-acyl-D-amino-acid deacylase
VLSRPVGMMMGLPSSMNPFYRRPSYMALDDLPWEERLARLADPDLKAKILGEENINPHIFVRIFNNRFDKMYPMEDPLEYLPDADQSVAARAERAGVDAASWLYDFFLANGGKNLIYIPAANYNADIPRLLQHPFTVSALGDGGAHVGSICDTSANVYVLTKWVKKESKVALAQAIHLLTAQPASLYSLIDRGEIKIGKKADINVIDLEALQLRTPHIVHDLPAGGKRFLQNADGLEATIVAGVLTFSGGEPTGALPGKLVRSGQIAG